METITIKCSYMTIHIGQRLNDFMPEAQDNGRNLVGRQGWHKAIWSHRWNAA